MTYYRKTDSHSTRIVYRAPSRHSPAAHDIRRDTWNESSDAAADKQHLRYSLSSFFCVFKTRLIFEIKKVAVHSFYGTVSLSSAL